MVAGCCRPAWVGRPECSVTSTLILAAACPPFAHVQQGVQRHHQRLHPVQALQQHCGRHHRPVPPQDLPGPRRQLRWCALVGTVVGLVAGWLAGVGALGASGAWQHHVWQPGEGCYRLMRLIHPPTPIPPLFCSSAVCSRHHPMQCKACTNTTTMTIDHRTGLCRPKTCVELNPACARCNFAGTQCIKCRHHGFVVDAVTKQCRPRVCTDVDPNCGPCEIRRRVPQLTCKVCAIGFKKDRRGRVREWGELVPSGVQPAMRTRRAFGCLAPHAVCLVMLCRAALRSCLSLAADNYPAAQSLSLPAAVRPRLSSSVEPLPLAPKLWLRPASAAQLSCLAHSARKEQHPTADC